MRVLRAILLPFQAADLFLAVFRRARREGVDFGEAARRAVAELEEEEAREKRRASN